jgi:protein-disulfide isomerase
MGDLVFSHQDEWGGKSEADASLFDGYAQQLGLSMKQWNADRESASVDERVQRDFNEGLKAGVEGTPTFFLNGEKINTPSSVEAFSDLLTEEGKASKQSR